MGCTNSTSAAAIDVPKKEAKQQQRNPSGPVKEYHITRGVSVRTSTLESETTGSSEEPGLRVSPARQATLEQQDWSLPSQLSFHIPGVECNEDLLLEPKEHANEFNSRKPMDGTNVTPPITSANSVDGLLVESFTSMKGRQSLLSANSCDRLSIDSGASEEEEDESNALFAGQRQIAGGSSSISSVVTSASSSLSTIHPGEFPAGGLASGIVRNPLDTQHASASYENSPSQGSVGVYNPSGSASSSTDTLFKAPGSASHSGSAAPLPRTCAREVKKKATVGFGQLSMLAPRALCDHSEWVRRCQGGYNSSSMSSPGRLTSPLSANSLSSTEGTRFLTPAERQEAMVKELKLVQDRSTEYLKGDGILWVHPVIGDALPQPLNQFSIADYSGDRLLEVYKFHRLVERALPHLLDYLIGAEARRGKEVCGNIIARSIRIPCSDRIRAVLVQLEVSFQDYEVFLADNESFRTTLEHQDYDNLLGAFRAGHQAERSNSIFAVLSSPYLSREDVRREEEQEGAWTQILPSSPMILTEPSQKSRPHNLPKPKQEQLDSYFPASFPLRICDIHVDLGLRFSTVEAFLDDYFYLKIVYVIAVLQSTIKEAAQHATG